ncbi:MAG: HAD family hydrolase [Candidatus Solibacter usitatus]|nr:HAD family hydrolase [Candidatus Solibacter usitatus]
MKPARRQHLLIDADDTLWENNVFFEQAFDEFVAYLDHSSLSPPEVRAVLDEIELANIKTHGYGAANFGRNLRQCYQRLVEREYAHDDLARIMALAERILDHPMEVIDGVEETLAYLAARHDLTLFTKGHPEEQKLKIDRSGLATYFGHTAIVKEKDAAAYTGLAAERALDAARTWMVGNSPKSDINPALAAGLRAVFIPHARTWGLEKEAVPENHERLLVLGNFTELREHF